MLRRVSVLSSGKYRCEVSGEAPAFQTVSDHGDMMVVGEYILECLLILKFKSGKEIDILERLYIKEYLNWCT